LSTAATQSSGSPVAGPPSIDRANIVSNQLQSALQLPLDQPVLVGGMTLDPTLKEPQGSQMYLILQVSASK